MGTNYVNCRIDYTNENGICRMCDASGESVWDIVSGWAELAQCEYKRGYTNVARMINFKLWKNYSLERSWRRRIKSQKVFIENEECKFSCKQLLSVNIRLDIGKLILL